VCRHVFAHLRPNRKTTALSPIRVSRQLAKSPLPRMPTSHSTLSPLSLPHSPTRSPRPSLALSSIAAPTTANAFLQASLSKMPRSNFSLPQHPAPRHFRSRLTTIQTSDSSHFKSVHWRFRLAQRFLQFLLTERQAPRFPGRSDFEASSIFLELIFKCELEKSRVVVGAGRSDLTEVAVLYRVSVIGVWRNL
jgi:hypothetical protein